MNCKRSLFIFFIIALPFGLFCSKKNTPERVVETVQSLVQQAKYEELRKCFTGDTNRAISRMESAFPDLNWKADFAGKFPEGSEWTIEKKQIENSRAEFLLKCVEHPVENVKGFKTVFKLSLEGGIWKIDMKSEMDQALKRAEDYRRTIESSADLRKFIR